MNLISIKNNFFFSEEIKTSTAQLKEDFGDFPPFPLCCNNTEINFRIVKVRGVGGFYNAINMITSEIKSANPKAEFKSSVQHGFVSDEQKIITDAAKSMYDLIEGQSKFFVYTLFCVSLPLLFVKLRNSRLNEGTISGYFMPIRGFENQITIRSDTVKRKNNLSSVVSHEHIHLLQYRNLKSILPAIKNADMLLCDKYKDDAHVLYLLDSRESEARLHEVVLSYYRVKKELPLTKDGFIQLLAGSNQLGWLVTSAMESNNVEFKGEITEYFERDVEFVKQLEYILLFCKNSDMLFRFITEVLPIMYGNLLKHYGDEESSLCFMNTVERPNLYDTLYV